MGERRRKSGGHRVSSAAAHTPFKAKLSASAAEKLQDIWDRKRERKQDQERREQEAAAEAESTLHDDLDMAPTDATH